MRRAHRRNGFLPGRALLAKWISVLFAGVRVFAAAVTGCTVAAAAFALPAALLGDPYNGQCKQDDQNDQRDDSTKCQHFFVPLFRKERFPHPVYTILPRRATESKKKKCDFFKIRACILAKAVL